MQNGWSRAIAAAAASGLHVLRLVDDHHRPRRLDELDRPAARHPILRPVDDVGLRRVLVLLDVLLEGLDVHHEELDRVRGRELPNPAELLRVVNRRVERHVVVQRSEVVSEQLDAGQNALADGDARDDDHELREAVGLVQLEDRAEVDVRLAGAGLHLDGEVLTCRASRRRNVIAFLHRRSQSRTKRVAAPAKRIDVADGG